MPEIGSWDVLALTVVSMVALNLLPRLFDLIVARFKMNNDARAQVIQERKDLRREVEELRANRLEDREIIVTFNLEYEKLRKDNERLYRRIEELEKKIEALNAA